MQQKITIAFAVGQFNARTSGLGGGREDGGGGGGAGGRDSGHVLAEGSKGVHMLAVDLSRTDLHECMADHQDRGDCKGAKMKAVGGGRGGGDGGGTVALTGESM